MNEWIAFDPSNALPFGAEGPRIDITFDRVSRKLSLFTQQQMGTWLSSELGKV